MQTLHKLILDESESDTTPFLHFSATSVLQDGLEKEVYEWLEHAEAWGLTEMDFYTQYEFSLFDVALPERLRTLISEDTVTAIKKKFAEVFGFDNYNLVGATAHKLVDGHKIGVHNDYIDGEETHRLVLQINPGWTDENGGYLMIFGSQDAEDLMKLVQPLNNTAFGFEISNRSYHAVSTVRNYSRYTIVYTFKAL